MKMFHRFEDRKVEMFHRSCPERNKLLIMELFGKPNSAIRLVIATDAFGLGIDIPDIRYVIFFGAPRSLEIFAQQSGRAGRDSKQSFSVMYAFPSHKSVDMKVCCLFKFCSEIHT